MAEDFRGMIGDRLRGAVRSRLTKFYTDRGYPPEQAATMADVELGRRDRQVLMNQTEPGYQGAGTGELAQMNRDYYRQNPGALSSERASDASLPGYDPSRSEVLPPVRYDRDSSTVTGGGTTVQFSEPLTANRAAEWSSDYPISRGSAEPYGGRGQAQPSIVDRAITAITPSREGPRATVPSAQAPETRDGRTPFAAAPAPERSEEVGEPGYSGSGGGYLQAALDVSRNSMAAPARAAAPARQAPARQAAPMPPSRPADMPRSSGEGSGKSWFSGMFKDPYEGKSSQDLFAMQQADPDNKGLYFRAAAKQAQERKDAGETVSQDGMKRGGAAGGHHKDAAIMKALEIIHHMLRRG
jgi:hypothetical protein